MITVWPALPEIMKDAEPIIREFEGFRSSPYLCPAGVPTIGYGTTRYPDGRKVTLADPHCTRDQAGVWLQASMARVLDGLKRSGAVKVAPTIGQAAALLSLAYNIGVGVHDGRKGDLADSALLEMFNRGDLDGAARQFLAWNKARVNGQLQALSGLTKRRERERALFITP